MGERVCVRARELVCVCARASELSADGKRRSERLGAPFTNAKRGKREAECDEEAGSVTVPSSISRRRRSGPDATVSVHSVVVTGGLGVTVRRK